MIEPEKGPPAAPKSLVSRLWPVAVIVLAAGAFFIAGGPQYLSLKALRTHYESLQGFVEAYYFAALALYMLSYIVVTALSLPGATLMSLLGGFLFGALIGTPTVVIAATIGACMIFLAARSAFRDFFLARAGGFIRKMEQGFSENAFSYLLLLRLVPVFPFFIVNIVPAFTTIRLRTYALATFIGIIPAAFAFVSAGAGLGAVLERGGEIELSGLLTQPEVLTPIIALSIVALIPVVYRALRKKRAAEPRA